MSDALTPGLRRLLRQIHNGSPILAATGWGMAGLLLLGTLFSLMDTRLVSGVNPWFKPIKFSLSILILVWSLSLLIAPLRQPARWLSLMSWIISACMIVEIVIIFAQAARGVPSHFNVSTPLNSYLFAAMGIAILVNTLAVASLLPIVVWFESPLSGLRIAGFGLGIVLFLVGSLIGSYMLVVQAHTIGGADGGPGLWLLGWSTKYGDLRPAHFACLHGLQVLPLLAWWLSRRESISDTLRSVLFFGGAALYLAAGVSLFRLATQSKPVWPQ